MADDQPSIKGLIAKLERKLIRKKLCLAELADLELEKACVIMNIDSQTNGHDTFRGVSRNVLLQRLQSIGAAIRKIEIRIFALG